MCPKKVIGISVKISVIEMVTGGKEKKRKRSISNEKGVGIDS
jgi:hypothetical protein